MAKLGWVRSFLIQPPEKYPELIIHHRPVCIVDLGYQTAISQCQIISNTIISRTFLKQNFYRFEAFFNPKMAPFDTFSLVRTMFDHYTKILNWLGTSIDNFTNFSNLNKVLDHDKGPFIYYVRKIVGEWVQANAYNCIYTGWVWTNSYVRF